MQHEGLSTQKEAFYICVPDTFIMAGFSGDVGPGICEEYLPFFIFSESFYDR